MSFSPCPDPLPGDTASCDAVELVIVPRARDIGGMEVARVLPSTHGCMIGPFIFFDRMGPVRFSAHQAEDVRPHPHIGLATVTYLFDGSMIHRDSLGTERVIEPGAVNLMTAGRGIVHSERHDASVKARGGDLFGIQSWIALPKAREEDAPAFLHAGVEALPEVSDGKVTARVILGSAFGATSPVALASPATYAEVKLGAGASLPIDPTQEDRALFTLEGEVEVDGVAFPPGQMLVIRRGLATQARALTPARLMLIGGEPLDGPRYIWWNFVASELDRIEHAKDAWRRGRFDLIPMDHDEFIPAPADGPGHPRPQMPRR
ncbi:pirin family protein [Xanthobacter dioxanivorans]|uniref:Pirin family protein n=1 Tax=Xanthobacter dioxanivorans TaxID=2528964 RepID=A0A974PQP2_9HYPH|nr:pirin family protein [Xanthobacter dioxanivorans]QRG07741.1 pirin family protein [Xanthobacter dioxanivorans]